MKSYFHRNKLAPRTSRHRISVAALLIQWWSSCSVGVCYQQTIPGIYRTPASYIGYGTDDRSRIADSDRTLPSDIYRHCTGNMHYSTSIIRRPPPQHITCFAALCTSKVEGSEVKAQLLLALAWFHGVVQERRIFMPQGWTKEYDFSVGDLR